MAVLVDTNVLVDVAVRDPKWLEWSRGQLLRLARHEPLVINPIIYSEFSVRYSDRDSVDALLPVSDFHRESLPWAAGFAAGVAFRIYRLAGGGRERVLPDFLIGAHAAIRGHKILTRDPKGYRSYFPDLDIISPDTHPL
ncbi:type II toxin-antitoxin system VapC family toxin [Peteryoungia desertarenae]|uniref:Type II toxin-antitoxin system VapC family toxin n=1 Tax=Peteryoungia desertarenae TaxID=1813451 RepID=A0ABX6QRC6_9HYPH|nr:type II toxin-antitoxin system VapC family toxin [Peteryoungia desertarenae]QLF71168.1 type II toxin-antitoxin system VapC family toxin [Peteryoungia desertarenae]